MVSCDIPAARKICGHVSALVSCHRCQKKANYENHQHNFAGMGDMEDWFVARDSNEHLQNALGWRRCNSDASRKRFVKQTGVRWIKQPKAIRSLVEIEAAKNYSPPAITSAIKEYVTLELGRWKELETVKNARLNLWNRTDNDPDSPYFIEFILQRSFSKEELQIMDNVKFGITVILMLLDPIYDQPEVSSSKVQEHMGKWDSDAVIQKWLKGKTPLEDDNIMDSDMISRNYNDNNSEEQNTTESDLKNNLGETNETALAWIILNRIYEHQLEKKIRAALIMVSCDIPAVRKVCGHVSALVSCHQCQKKANYENHQHNFAGMEDMEDWFVAKN
ncbi:hypothetical protein RhiirA1_400309 [Rhizophagus irregularis]|uniref:Transposase domain-containing protein n=1 Tax=Rhizophagus irregularis TaxID=588596 RepID=A0A2N0R6L3_9GLOM|nr:hypothetical protein RhiirA1_400309 [Rhizophagus irregularis]